MASAKIRSPNWAGFKWLMLRWIPATLWKPLAMLAPMLARASAISAYTPPCWFPSGSNFALSIPSSSESSSLNSPDGNPVNPGHLQMFFLLLCLGISFTNGK
ncbi:hypothetical protein COLO4_08196 [Corchorus olitorius]|uniref:Uncharacterized protein n=1 Tax=Corchorus olitorius TaxID=93759 RepID=A0A1R3KGV8_9ROSI|nr:hypothetical protein COLO4_08196 [Corchorus olitorius]